MGWHKRLGGRHDGRHGYGRNGFYRQSPEYFDRGAAPLGRPKPVLWAIAIVAAILWSLAAWLAYGWVDPFFGWLSANAGPVAPWSQSGGISGLLGQVTALLQAIAKPAIVIVWAVGGLGLLAAPIILPAVIRLRRRFHH